MSNEKNNYYLRIATANQENEIAKALFNADDNYFFSQQASLLGQ